MEAALNNDNLGQNSTYQTVTLSSIITTIGQQTGPGGPGGGFGPGGPGGPMHLTILD